MTIAELKRAVERQPFAPFVLCLADGREFLVHGRYQIVWSDLEDDPRRIAYAFSGGKHEFLELTQIASIRCLSQSSADGDGEEKRP
jgi:hypothetical protein